MVVIPDWSKGQTTDGVKVFSKWAKPSFDFQGNVRNVKNNEDLQLPPSTPDNWCRKPYYEIA